MTHAYGESYAAYAQPVLGEMMDYAVNDLKLDADEYFQLFADSPWGVAFSKGAPYAVVGKSGVELAMSVLNIDLDDARYVPCSTATWEKSPEYWAGWALAYYQWWSNRTFSSIIEDWPISKITLLYNPYHEMDIMQFVDKLEGTR